MTILKNERVRRNLSQETLANLADMEQASLSKYERGEMAISLRRASRICNVLGLTRPEIFDANGYAVELAGSDE